MEYTTPKRFFSLDVLRGIASLSVVLWHWQHFTANLSNNKVQPFYSFLFLFYKQGLLAVPLFFTLSGFIFFWLYSNKINTKETNWKQFFILRFSRLYPLHFITLLVVLGIQILSMQFMGLYIVYPFNDLYHFILNIFFISNWGLQKGFSFNGPVWSVSIEVLLYIVFFICAYFKLTKSILLCALIVTINYCLHYPPEIKYGLHSFFIGGICYLLYDTYLKNSGKIFTTFITTATFVCWLVAILSIKYNFNWNTLIGTENALLLKGYSFFIQTFYMNILFPLTIITLAIIETQKGELWRSYKFIGDVTYSIYLIHFPLQAIFILLINYFGLSTDIYYSNTFFIAFFSLLFLAAHLSFKYFEIPTQLAIRQYWQSNKHGNKILVK